MNRLVLTLVVVVVVLVLCGDCDAFKRSWRRQGMRGFKRPFKFKNMMSDQPRRPNRRTGGENWFNGNYRRPGRFNLGLSNPGRKPAFNFDLDLSWGNEARNEPWWTGPNVCFTEKEEKTNETGEITHHYNFQSIVCDGTDTAFKCVKTKSTPEGKIKVTEIYECCMGYTRSKGDYGCEQELPLMDIPTLLETLELNELIQFFDSAGVDPAIFNQDSANFTVFAPSDQAFNKFRGVVSEMSSDITDITLMDDSGSVVLVSERISNEVVDNSKNILLGHVASGVVTAPKLSDNMLIETASPYKSKIRINTYTRPVQLLTANCKKVSNTDNMATNGVVHIVDEIITPVTETLHDLIRKHPELGMLKSVIGTSELNAALKNEDSTLTVLAPTDAAFKKHPKLLNDKKCLINVLKNHVFPDVVCSGVIQGQTKTRNLLDKYTNLTRADDGKVYADGAQVVVADITNINMVMEKYVLKNHVFPDVVCSGVIQGQTKTRNLLDKYTNLTRADDGKVYADGAQVVVADSMATNGVLHIIDDVLIPDEGHTTLEIAVKNGLTSFNDLVEKAGLKKELTRAENVTVFAPTNEAIQALPADVLESLAADPEELRRVLLYHVVPGEQTCYSFFNNKELDTLESSGQKVRINEYSPFPFGRQWIRTAQCAEIDPYHVKSCNGIIQVINKVMIPPSGTIVDVLARETRFSTLVDLVKRAKLADTLLEEGPYTIFAPTNDAFTALGSDAIDELLQSPNTLKNVLLNHVSKDFICCAGIQRSSWLRTQKVRTLSGEMYSIKKNRRGDVMVGDADVIQCDLTGTNGVIHVIDNILMEQPRSWQRDWGWGY